MKNEPCATTQTAAVMVLISDGKQTFKWECGCGDSESGFTDINTAHDAMNQHQIVGLPCKADDVNLH